MPIKTIITMKKTIIILLALSMACTSAFAQMIPATSSYKNLKGVYDPRDYVKSDVDAYSVAWIGIESFFAPGTGQLIMRESGRGWAFLGASVVIGSIGSGIAQDLVDLFEKNADGEFEIPEADKDKAKSKLLALGVVALAELGVNIWSCIDAVRIAKVKNQYYQDLNGKHAFSTSLYPSVDLVQNGNSVVPAAGMTLAIKF